MLYHWYWNITEISRITSIDITDGIFLAYSVNGQILPLEHGYPIRLVAKDSLGFDWVKWVEIIEVR